MFQRVAAALLLRRMVTDLGVIARALDRQTLLLGKLVDRYAPEPLVQSPGDRATIKAETGVSYVDATEVALAEDFAARQHAHTGHTPDDEELAIYLDDEHTRDLKARLDTRDADLDRLMESRR